MQTLIDEIFPYYQNIRRTLHAWPELRYEETQTAKLIASELDKLGLPYQMGIGKTGVVALLDTGKPGKTLGLRADMDALPIVEDTHLPYQSKNIGVMHACGHDGHVATLLAAAHMLCKHRHLLTGKIKFIFQPAEEGGAGAKAMIEEGVLENPKVDAIFGLHNHPGAAVGTLLTKPGCAMYGNHEFVLHVHGKGGHAAQPEQTNNPLVVAADIILKLKQLHDELCVGDEPTVITMTQCQSGFTTNVIPDTTFLQGTIRAASNTHFTKASTRLKQVLANIEKQHQVGIELEYNEIYPPTINTPAETAFVLEQARICLGNENAILKPSSSRAAEDFSYFLNEIPGCYFFMGNGENSACCHNTQYDFNDEIIKHGAKLFTQIALRFLAP